MLRIDFAAMLGLKPRRKTYMDASRVARVFWKFWLASQRQSYIRPVGAAPVVPLALMVNREVDAHLVTGLCTRLALVLRRLDQPTV